MDKKTQDSSPNDVLTITPSPENQFVHAVEQELENNEAVETNRPEEKKRNNMPDTDRITEKDVGSNS